jgi:hypothetical protein
MTETMRLYLQAVNKGMVQIYCDSLDIPGSADRISNSGPSLGEEYAVAQRPKAIVHRMLVFMAVCSELLEL